MQFRSVEKVLAPARMYVGICLPHRLIDVHTHLEEVPNLEEELDRAKAAGVIAVIAVGSDEASNETALEVAKLHEGFVFPALGLHPWDVSEDFEDELRFIEENIDGCVALGEVGLDFKIQKPKKLQVEAFRRVLELASKHEKPPIIHSRWAWRDALDLVNEARIKRAIFHWYSGPLEVLKELLGKGHYVSATPAAEYSGPHRFALREVPLDRLLLETDSPVPYRGSESRPSDVVKTLKAVARLKGVSEDEVASATTANALELFDLEPRLRIETF